MKRLLFVSSLLLVLVTSTLGQKIGSESEIATDGKGHLSFSQYLFIDSERWNGLVRYVVVQEGVNRGEFAFGPTFSVGRAKVKLQLGGTTSRQAMVAGVLIIPARESAVVWIADAKLSTTNAHHTLYQKLFVPLTSTGTWQLRVEDLQVGPDQAFVRLGVEYRLSLPHKTHLYFAPYFDPKTPGLGINLGLRF